MQFSTTAYTSLDILLSSLACHKNQPDLEMAYIKILLVSTFQIFYKITFYLCNMNIFAMLIPQEPNITLVGLFIIFIQRVHQV